MFYSYRNFLCKLNSNEMFCIDGEIAYQANIEPTYLIGNRYSFDYRAVDGINGNFRFSYYLTGKDFLKDYTTNETNVLSGNFCGLHFNSGYINQYSINGEPNTPVIVNANIAFFEDLKGTFIPQTIQNTGLDILNFSDVTLNNLSTFSLDNPLIINSFSYNFNSDIKPLYNIISGESFERINPYRILFGPKSIEGQIICDSLSGGLLFTGQNEGLTITFTHPSIPSLNESITISGKLYQRNISTSVGNLLKTTLNIKQHFVENPPIISSVTYNP